MKHRNHPHFYIAFLVLAAIAASELTGPAIYPNDPTNDSAPGVAWLWQHGYPIPAGVYYCKTQIDSGYGVSNDLVGAGSGDQARADGAWREYKVTVLADVRPEKVGGLVKIRRSAVAVRTIQLSGCRMYTATTPAGTGTLIEVTQQGAAWPVGDICFDRVTLTNAARGWYFAPGSHCDHIDSKNCIVDNVAEPYVINENQSVEHTIHLTTKSGGGRSIIVAKDGGRLKAQLTILDKWDSILELGDAAQNTGPTKNNGSYDLEVWLDNTTYIANSVVERRAYEQGAALVKIRGFAGHDTALGDPILLNARSRVSVNVERIYRPAFAWPLEEIPAQPATKAPLRARGLAKAAPANDTAPRDGTTETEANQNPDGDASEFDDAPRAN